MASRKLLLFDIDGTLLDTGGAGLTAISMAMRRTFPEATRHALMPSIELAGATDSGLVKLLFAHFGIPETPENIEHFYDNYLDELGREVLLLFLLLNQFPAPL